MSTARKRPQRASAPMPSTERVRARCVRHAARGRGGGGAGRRRRAARGRGDGGASGGAHIEKRMAQRGEGAELAADVDRGGAHARCNRLLRAHARGRAAPDGAREADGRVRGAVEYGARREPRRRRLHARGGAVAHGRGEEAAVASGGIQPGAPAAGVARVRAAAGAGRRRGRRRRVSARVGQRREGRVARPIQLARARGGARARTVGREGRRHLRRQRVHAELPLVAPPAAGRGARRPYHGGRKRPAQKIE